MTPYFRLLAGGALAALLTTTVSLTGCSKGNPAGATAPVYDGSWTGVTSQGSPISFTIVNNSLCSLQIAVSISGAYCNISIEPTVAINPGKSLTGNQFDFSTTFGNVPFSVHGEYGPADSFSGVIHASSTQCDGTVDIAWNATKHTQSQINLTGTWIGTYSTSLIATSDVTFNLTQTEAQYSGTYYSTNKSQGTITGTISNSTMAFSLHQTTVNCNGDFSGSATVTNDTMRFSFTGSDCLGYHANGTGTAIKQ